MNPDAPFHDPASDSPSSRPRLRPPVGLPERGGPRGWRGTAASVAVHVGILLLLIVPFFASDRITEVLGAGGPGPAGGGGGGSGGTGGRMVQERLQYVQVAPAPKPVPTVAPVVPPVVPPIVPPVTPPPKPVVTPPAATPPAATVPATPPASVTPGTGGGSGNDGTQGNGPGIGGGVGAGEGTGRGNANGAGTGGGPGSVYHAAPNLLVILPQAPSKAKGDTIVARFDVDEKGNVLSFDFNPTRDGGYNQKVREALRQLRFRPATRLDGTPVRDTTTVTYIAY